MTSDNKEPRESWHQKQLIQWCRQFSWGQFLFHIANESTGGIEWVVRNRMMGCRKGVPDLMLPIPSKGYHGLFLEMKNSKGKLSREQKAWIEALNTFGYKAVVCNGFEEAREILKNYMEGGG